MGLSLMNMLPLSSSVRIAHIACYWTFLLVHYIQVLCQFRLCKADHAHLTYLMLQRQFSHCLVWQNGYQYFEERNWIHFSSTIASTMNMEPACSSETLVLIYETISTHKPRRSQYEMEWLMNSEQVNIYMQGTVACFMVTSQNSPR
jgi:hypothetical protein